MKEVVAAFNQVKALVGAFSVIVKTMDRLQMTTWTSGHEGWSSASPEEMAPLRKVGPRLSVMLENQMMNTPKATHCGPFLRILSESPAISSGRMGVLSSTQVSRLIWGKREHSWSAYCPTSEESRKYQTIYIHTIFINWKSNRLSPPVTPFAFDHKTFTIGQLANVL